LRSIQPIKNGLGLRELQAVLAVAELGSFRRAAGALGYGLNLLFLTIERRFVHWAGK